MFGQESAVRDSAHANYNAAQSALKHIGLPKGIFCDDVEYIKTARQGLPGAVLKNAVDVLGNRDFFTHLLNIDRSNLSRLYRKKFLNQNQSEELLDVIHMFVRAEQAFGDFNHALDWMHASIAALGNEKPIDLCDTFKGRELVEQTLRKIEFGEFV